MQTPQSALVFTELPIQFSEDKKVKVKQKCFHKKVTCMQLSALSIFK